jgi:putative hydrolase of the HAD superfamily
VQLTHLVFDVDNTLYPPARGVVERVDALITEFVAEHLAMTREEADALRARYREEHGTTLAGLMRHHEVAPDEYLARVHAIEIEALLEPDDALHAMLQALPHEKVVFTNGSAAHAERVLARLGVRGCFGEIFSLERVAYVPKPFRDPFERVLRALAVPASRCLLIDDRLDNLRTGHALGMRTMLVGAEAAPETGVDFAVASILQLGEVLAPAGP